MRERTEAIYRYGAGEERKWALFSRRRRSIPIWGSLFLHPTRVTPPNGHGRSRDRLRWVQRGRRRRGWRVLCTSEQSWQPRGRVSDIANPSFPRRRSETDLGADPCPPVRLPVPSFLPKTVIFSFSRSVSKAGISTSSTSHSFRSEKGREIRALSFREILFLYFSFTYLGFFFARTVDAKRSGGNWVFLDRPKLQGHKGGIGLGRRLDDGENGDSSRRLSDLPPKAGGGFF